MANYNINFLLVLLLQGNSQQSEQSNVALVRLQILILADIFDPMRSLVFNEMILHVIYDQIRKCLLVFREFFNYFEFQGHFQEIRSNKPANGNEFSFNQRPKTKRHQKIQKMFKKYLENSLTKGRFKLFFPKILLASLHFEPQMAQNTTVHKWPYLMNMQDPRYHQKSKPILSPEQNYFVHFDMRYPVSIKNRAWDLPIQGTLHMLWL